MVIDSSRLFRLVLCTTSLVFGIVHSQGSTTNDPNTKFAWIIDCSDGILSPTAATLQYEVTYNGEIASNFSYSVDFVMQWSDDVTLNSTLSGFQLGTPFEYILTYLYPSEGVYTTNFTAIIRVDEETIDFPNSLANSEYGAIKIGQESCEYPFSTTPPPTPTETTTNDALVPTSASLGNGAHSSTFFITFTVIAGSSVYLLLL